MKRTLGALPLFCIVITALAAAGMLLPANAPAQTAPADVPPAAPAPTTRAAHISAAPGLEGRTIEDVRIIGNALVSTSVIRNVIRSHEGDKFDPATVEEDYKRIYELKKFSNVEARVEPTATGVILIFEVSEQRQINSIRYIGNTHFDNLTLKDVVDIKPGESIDHFRIDLGRQGLERFYREKNYPFTRVTVDDDLLANTGDLVYRITEGPNVRIRKIQVIGNRSFTTDKLKEQVKSSSWVFILRKGTLDFSQLDDDVAAMRQYYEQHGFFDARVGRRLDFSPDQTEVMVTFVVNEGMRYAINQVRFERINGNVLPESKLREGLKLVPGQPYDVQVLRKDIRSIVGAYSKFGFIYLEQELARDHPEYLQINPKTVFVKEPGKVDLVYEIHEGKPFRIGNIFVRGNDKLQQKVILRELNVHPGEVYNSAELLDAQERLRATQLIEGSSITPIGDDPNSRDVLVEVKEGNTAFFSIGAGATSNGGILGSISYEQKNFDISNIPSSWGEFFSNRAFTGAGQYFRILFEPGTQQTRARISFREPWLFDQPYSFGNDIYYDTRLREHWNEVRVGDTVEFGKRFNREYSAGLTLRGENVLINKVSDPIIRAPEIVIDEGNHTITSTSLSLRRDTTATPILPGKGSVIDAEWEHVGTFGGEYDFDKFTAGIRLYQTLGTDLLDRKTILTYRLDAGYIHGDAPFFERFYGGGTGSIRGFKYRGVSPRAGLDSDPIGGDFTLTGGLELGFPLMGDTLRGVVFSDVGDVEPSLHLGTIRVSAGFGVRLTLPILGQLPLALDFAIPINKANGDSQQVFSFAFGFAQ